MYNQTPWFRVRAVPHCNVAKLLSLIFCILQSFTITSRKHSICFSTSWCVELICVPLACRFKQAAGGATAAQLCTNTHLKKKETVTKLQCLEGRQWRRRCFLLIGWPAGAPPTSWQGVSVRLCLTSPTRLWLTEVVLWRRDAAGCFFSLCSVAFGQVFADSSPFPLAPPYYIYIYLPSLSFLSNNSCIFQ